MPARLLMREAELPPGAGVTAGPRRHVRPRQPPSSDLIIDPSTITDEERAGQLSVRAVAAGMLIGSLLCASNAFFALQTGWVTMASLQAAVVGFGMFRAASSACGCRRLTMLENVVVQTASVAASTLPLAAGFAGIVPAFELMRAENAPDAPPALSTPELLLWALALSLFGVFLAVPLRRDAILVEKLRFPSGTATAEVIAVLHKAKLAEAPPPAPAKGGGEPELQPEPATLVAGDDETGPLAAQPGEARGSRAADAVPAATAATAPAAGEDEDEAEAAEWRERWQVLGGTMLGAAMLSVITEFVPVVRSIPLMQWLGVPFATSIGWTLTPSLSYVGQGMIMGPKTTLSMLLGSFLAWAVMAPLAEASGWSSGPVGNQTTGVKSWVTWLSLAVMLADSSVIIATTAWRLAQACRRKLFSPRSLVTGRGRGSDEEQSLVGTPGSPRLHAGPPSAPEAAAEGAFDPAEAAGENVPASWWLGGLAAGTLLCVVALSSLFQSPLYEPLVAVLLSCVVAVVAARALGETDLNPVSGVGKLSQLVFAGVAPGRVTSNLVAGAVAEAGAQQAGDLLQDLKTGHLLGASPRAQFVAQIAGSLVGVLVSVGSYRLLTAAYPVGGTELPAPTARVWLGMAQLVNGRSLPPMSGAFTAVFGVVAAAVSAARYAGSLPRMAGTTLARVTPYLPSVMAVGVGMYIAPNWVLPRCLGSLVQVLWRRADPQRHDRLMLLTASGFVLGEGLTSILNAGLRAGGARPWSCIGCYGELQCSGC